MIEVRILNHEPVRVSVIHDGKTAVTIPDTRIIPQNIYPTYTGAAEITPTQEAQILRTTEHVLFKDIKINPIPSNWGRIEYDGSRIRIV